MVFLKKTAKPKVFSKCRFWTSCADLQGFFGRTLTLISPSLAGSDTTATALRTTLFHIVSQPHVYNSLRTEITRFEQANLLSHPMATDQECRNLPYLQACIKEGLRVRPPANAIFGRIVPPEGDTINGIFIPGGTEVGLNFWAVLRNKEVFGSDAHVFRPERWFEGDDTKKYKMERTAELVFNVGRFMCMGKTIALMELNKCLVEVRNHSFIHQSSSRESFILTCGSVIQMIRRYDWTRVEPNKPFKSVCWGIIFQQEMWMRVSDRDHS